MKTNEELRARIQEAFTVAPLLGDALIGVIVRDGIATLMGSVDDLRKKVQAVQAAKKVKGILAVVDHIAVITATPEMVSDHQMAQDACIMLNGSLIVPRHTITIVVEQGRVTLEGTVAEQFHKAMAIELIQDLAGVRAVVDRIRVRDALYN